MCVCVCVCVSQRASDVGTTLKRSKLYFDGDPMYIARRDICILYTYTVSRVTYTDEYRACIWTSLGEFRYERYESVYVTLLTV